MSLSGSYLRNAKAIPKRMRRMKINLFLIVSHKEDNKKIKPEEKGKYKNE